MEDGQTNKWWGYKHVNGSYQVKRYFGQQDILDAMESDFVEKIEGAFEATDREDAINKLKQYFDGNWIRQIR